MPPAALKVMVPEGVPVHFVFGVDVTFTDTAEYTLNK